MARVTSRQSETVEHHFDTFTAMDIVLWPECRDLGTEADRPLSPSLMGPGSSISRAVLAWTLSEIVYILYLSKAKLYST